MKYEKLYMKYSYNPRFPPHVQFCGLNPWIFGDNLNCIFGDTCVNISRNYKKYNKNINNIKKT